MHLSLFVTCVIDQLCPKVGEATLTLLEQTGCTVDFNPRQTCCGQPACNAGYENEAQQVARHTLDVLEGDNPIVVPSGSCAAQLKHYDQLFPADDPDHERALALAPRIHELSEFLVDHLQYDASRSGFKGILTWHDACHSLRELGIKNQPRQLLAQVPGVELIEASECETCCGFGGTFAIKLPDLSVAMTDRKLDEIETLGVDGIVSTDASCLMQLGSRLANRGSKIRALHLAEILTQ
ncbi:MAG: Fe-S oxidoreductase [Planctomycetes bacterium]|jgi:L-lactate dehydrogenase complex protein LldE|nr:Fe-S oxidoreductase [Planctomycetota bacterium]